MVAHSTDNIMIESSNSAAATGRVKMTKILYVVEMWIYLYDSEYSLIIDIYFYETSLLKPQALVL